MPELRHIDLENAGESGHKRRARRKASVAVACAIGVAWDVLAAGVVFFHSYTFFEFVVVCLLVMILSTVATMRNDFEFWSGVFRRAKQSSASERTEPDVVDELRWHLKGVFYGIAFIIALIGLAVALFG